MTSEQWNALLSVINGDIIEPLPVGFIIDHPWLPKWAGVTIKEYFEDDSKWLEANFKAQRQFPDILFLPGFWSEYGMCTEPSAFGSRCIWHDNDSPFAEKVINHPRQAKDLKKPDVAKDGLLPKIIERLDNCAGRIRSEGHEIRFAVARGPLNIASFLMGSTEFLTALPTYPNEMRHLLEVITDFIVDWLRYQKARFPSIEGILILDDIVGFIGEDDFNSFAMPYLTDIFHAFTARVRFFHNDAQGLVCAPFLEAAGVNLFNFSHDHTIPEMKEKTRGKVVLLGNIPSRDVLAKGEPGDVAKTVRGAIASSPDRRRLILSAGGGMSPDVPTANLRAFVKACHNIKADEIGTTATPSSDKAEEVKTVNSNQADNGVGKLEEALAACVEFGKVNRAAVFPPHLKGQDGADEIAAAALKGNISPDSILAGCMLGMERVGDKFGRKKVFVPELLMAARAMTAAMDHLKPFFESGDVRTRGKFVIGTVKGDLHDIGKNLVAMILRGSGWEIVDLGVDVPADTFLRAAMENPGCVVGLSALLTTTMEEMESTVHYLKNKGFKGLIMVGGAPVTREFAEKIGADGFGADPNEARDFLEGGGLRNSKL